MKFMNAIQNITKYLVELKKKKHDRKTSTVHQQYENFKKIQYKKQRVTNKK